MIESKPCPLCGDFIDAILSACANCTHRRLTYEQRNNLALAESQHWACLITTAELEAYRRQVFSMAKGA